MVLADLPGHHLTRLVRLAAKDTGDRLGLPTSDASVDPDAVLPAADCLAQSPEVVRDSRRSASADAPEAARQVRQGLPRQDVPPKAVRSCLV
jgi:hypothetical protein